MDVLWFFVKDRNYARTLLLLQVYWRIHILSILTFDGIFVLILGRKEQFNRVWKGFRLMDCGRIVSEGFVKCVLTTKFREMTLKWPFWHQTDFFLKIRHVRKLTYELDRWIHSQHFIHPLFIVTLGDREVVCDMTSGGWLVIQQRVGKKSGTTDFYRNWNDYKSGFGRLQKMLVHVDLI